MSTSFASRDTAIVNAKGQITIPKQLRDELQLAPGDEVRFVLGAGNRLFLTPRNHSLEDLFGSLKSPHDRPLTLEELKDAAADGWAFGEPDESIPANEDTRAA